MPTWTFRFGDVFDANDPLSVWVCTLAIAFNDVIHANLKVLAAEKGEWERFYEWRVATSHFNEACLHLERGTEIAEVNAFIEGEKDLKERYDGAMSRYAEIRGIVNRLRNEAAFHYPYRSGQAAVSRALGELEDEEGSFSGGDSNRLKDSRLLFADDVVAHMVWNAAGGTETHFEQAVVQLADAVTELVQFTNATLDAYFLRHQHELRREG